MTTIIKSKKQIQWGKVLVIEELYANQGTIDAFKENLKSNKKGITEEQINQEIQNLVMKDNYYNKVMDEIASAYEIEFDEVELKKQSEIFKSPGNEISEEQLINKARAFIIKKIIYHDLAACWEIVVTDDMVKNTLENFYKTTGNPIREYLVDPEKFAEVKETILEQIISERILNAFKGEFKLEKNSKS